MDRGRGVSLFGRALNDPVTAVLSLMGIQSEVRLLRVVAVMMVEVRIALNQVCSTIAIIMRVRDSPYLALLRSSGGPFILMGEAMWVVTPLTRPLRLLVRRHPCTLVREVTVVAPPTHIVMRVVAATLSTNRRRGLIGARAGLLDGSQSTLSHSMWRRVTPGPFGYIIILQRLLLPQWGG